MSSVRLLAVSATVPNANDLAKWLGVPVPEAVKVFGEELRPVPLRTVVKAYPKGKRNDFIFERKLSSCVWSVIQEYSRGKPSLVFCSSRKSAENTASIVAEEAVRMALGRPFSVLIRDEQHYLRLQEGVSGIQDSRLKSCILNGVGFHNAAMSPDDRAAVEILFRNGDIMILCATSTLAVGVNLPAFLVVIKGTKRYAGHNTLGGYEEYERSTVVQMMGRAGRPQFDVEGCAVIMTEQTTESRYTQLASNKEDVESTLLTSLPEFLNAEIVLGTVNDVAAAIYWLRSTFFYVRVRLEPSKYGAPRALLNNPEGLEQWLRDVLLLGTLRRLSEAGMVRFDDDNFAIEPLQPGIIMAENYVKLSTMVNLCKCPPASSLSDLIWVVANSEELKSIVLRRSEKKVLNECNKSDALRYHVMSAKRSDRVADRIATASDKIFVLLNRALADNPPGKIDYSLKQDTEHALNVGTRLSTAFYRYFLHQNRAGDTFNALILGKSLRQRIWTGSKLEVKQVPGVGPVLSQRLMLSGIHQMKDLAATDARKLESLAKCPFPWGTKIHDALRRLLPPRLELTCYPVSYFPGGVDLQIELIRKGPPIVGTDHQSENDSSSRDTYSHIRCPMRLIVGIVDDNRLLTCRNICANTFPSPMVLSVRASALAGVQELHIICSLVHERLIGADVATKATVSCPAVYCKRQEAAKDCGTPHGTSVVGDHRVKISPVVPSVSPKNVEVRNRSGFENRDDRPKRFPPENGDALSFMHKKLNETNEGLSSSTNLPGDSYGALERVFECTPKGLKSMRRCQSPSDRIESHSKLRRIQPSAPHAGECSHSDPKIRLQDPTDGLDQHARVNVATPFTQSFQQHIRQDTGELKKSITSAMMNRASEGRQQALADDPDNTGALHLSHRRIFPFQLSAKYMDATRSVQPSDRIEEENEHNTKEKYEGCSSSAQHIELQGRHASAIEADEIFSFVST